MSDEPIKNGRPRTCECGACRKCRRREREYRRYQAMTIEERAGVIARRDPEKQREAKRRQSGTPKRIATHRRYYERHKDEILPRQAEYVRTRVPRNVRRARALLQYAVDHGHVVRQPCEVCGTTERIEAHHEDYDRPLDVRWVCSLHHKRLHPR